jgi:hypothetical protein
MKLMAVGWGGGEKLISEVSRKASMFDSDL